MDIQLKSAKTNVRMLEISREGRRAKISHCILAVGDGLE